ncbi:uncharacterized protein LOC128884740 [Hylaeus volcanicus]|uniref:uncharacterized protein LOC128884740 n=1 Tax=Hylaeus volcanicus TaxID=313075 RepID=UPI0023B77980|nr:uncharacterized protein LOC128884740 [Hylaeus volcanicus]
MLEVPMFSVDKFVHTFVQNLGLRIQSPVYKNFSKISFIKYIDRTCKVKEQLFCTIEKIKDINVQQNLDFSNEKDIRYFIEKHTRFSDKFTSSSNTHILTSHLKNINVKILEKVRARKRHFDNIKEREIKISNKNTSCKKKLRINLQNKLDGLKKNLSPTLCKPKVIDLHNNYKRSKFRNVLACESRIDNNISKTNNNNNNQKVSSRHNLPNSLMSIAKKEVEMAEGFIRLHTKDIESIKKKLHVTLYIAKSESYRYNAEDQIRCNQLLCHHAILCLIEPSEKAFVLYENDLSVVIKKYLMQGYEHHFEFQRNSQDYYIALLILSQWAKVLVKHPNTTMMLTLCGILGCNVEEILVLNSPEGMLL